MKFDKKIYLLKNHAGSFVHYSNSKGKCSAWNDNDYGYFSVIKQLGIVKKADYVLQLEKIYLPTMYTLSREFENVYNDADLQKNNLQLKMFECEKDINEQLEYVDYVFFVKDKSNNLNCIFLSLKQLDDVLNYVRISESEIYKYKIIDKDYDNSKAVEKIKKEAKAKKQYIKNTLDKLDIVKEVYSNSQIGLSKAVIIELLNSYIKNDKFKLDKNCSIWIE